MFWSIKYYLDCEITVVARQLRISNSKDLLIFAFSASDPALEKDKNIKFAPFNWIYNELEEQFKSAKIDPSI